MKRISSFLFMLLIFNFVYSQQFTELGLNKFAKYSFAMFNNKDSLNLYLIFSQTITSVSPKDQKIHIGEVAKLEAFSQDSFLLDTNVLYLPYLKISLYDDEDLWIKGSDAFIFNKDLPDTSFKLNNVEYKVFFAGNMRFVQEKEKYSYAGYKLIVVLNTFSHQYFLLKTNEFPEQLQGHSYKSHFAYLEDDLRAKEKIEDVLMEKNHVELRIKAKYKKGGAEYSIIFYPYNTSIAAKYTSSMVLTD